MASNGNAHPCSLSAKRRSNSSPELQVHGMDCKEMEDLPVLKLSNSQEDEPGSSSSADRVSDAGPVPRICLEHLRALPRSDGYIGPNMNETDTPDDSSEMQEKKHKTPCNASLQNVTDDKENDESMVLRPESESSSKPQTKRRPNGLSRVASVLVSKFYSKERPKKPEQQISKEVDIEPSNADCTGLQRGRSKSLSGRILRRFRDASRDSSKDGDESRTSTPKRRQSHRETVKSRAERTQNQAWHGRAKRYTPLINFAEFDPQLYPTECEEDIQRAIREKEIQEGVDPPPGFQPQYFSKGCSKKDSSASLNTCTCPPNVPKSQTRSPPPAAAAVVKDSSVAPYPQLSKVVPEEMKEELIKSPTSPPPAAAAATPSSSSEAMYMTPQVHTQVDYMHCLVPDQQGIMNSCFYWGKIDRYEADEILENKPEGTFLLRDSSQEEFLFSVSFRRYGRTLHARIEQWNHKFSFDAHDPSVYSCDTICGLLEHYKDPNYCMFFEPMLTIPLPRTNPPSLQELARSVICSQTTYDGVHFLELPRVLKDYLKEYHYKQRVRVRHLNNHPETQEETVSPKFVYNVSKTCISR